MRRIAPLHYGIMGVFVILLGFWIGSYVYLRRNHSSMFSPAPSAFTVMLQIPSPVWEHELLHAVATKIYYPLTLADHWITGDEIIFLFPATTTAP